MCPEAQEGPVLCEACEEGQAGHCLHEPPPGLSSSKTSSPFLQQPLSRTFGERMRLKDPRVLWTLGERAAVSGEGRE